MKLYFISGFVIFLITVLSSQCLNIELINEDVVLNRRVGGVLLINVHYSTNTELLQDNGLSKLSLVKNGKICQSHENYTAKEIILSEKCTSRKAHWFAISISIKNTDVFNKATSTTTAAISSPLYITKDVENICNIDNLECSIKSESGNTKNMDSFITLILPVTLDDLSRCALLFQSLQLISPEIVLEMLIYVPDFQYDIMKLALLGFISHLYFPAIIFRESDLFKNKQLPSVYPYAIQMAIKLLVSRVVKTHYYMTLDADVILLKKFTLENFLISSSSFKKRALYEHEGRFLHHPHWWVGSEALLRISSSTSDQQGFGVTPALLSTFGSLLTLATLEDAVLIHLKEEKPILPSISNDDSSSNFCIEGDGELEDSFGIASSNNKKNSINCINSSSSKIEYAWLNSFGRDGLVWSEYTLYRIVLDHYQLFDALHIREGENKDISKLNSFDDENAVRLHCYDVWYAHDLPWKAKEALHSTDRCLFSVVQSSTGVSPSAIFSLWSDNF